jgi:hypothetical protein
MQAMHGFQNLWKGLGALAQGVCSHRSRAAMTQGSSPRDCPRGVPPSHDDTLSQCSRAFIHHTMIA